MRATEIRDDLLAADDVVPTLAGWLAAGSRAALVTLLASDGPGPRAVGAQMAVREDGAFAGYLSGGCLERAVVDEARRAIAERRNRRVRFGGADGYFDLVLPCGSALDLYVDQQVDAADAAALSAAGEGRRRAVRRTDIDSGTSVVEIAGTAEDDGAASRFDGACLVRIHRPRPRLVVLGSSPLVPALARTASLVGVEIEVATPDAALAARLAASGIRVHSMSAGRLPEAIRPDCWTASVVAFHEHDDEPALLAALLALPGFYVGALGSRAVHQRRVERLAWAGVDAAGLARLRGSIGVIGGAKTQAALALGIVTEVLAAARDSGFID